MIDRVACANPRCRAHRDRALPHTERCFVCGHSAVIEVPPNAADLDEAIDAARRKLLALEAWKVQLRLNNGLTPTEAVN